MNTRLPTFDDVDELRDLIDAQESALDPRHKPAPTSWPFELVKGRNDEPRNQVWSDGDRIVAWVTMQPDAHRRRIEVELFREPGFAKTAEVWAWCLKVAETEYPGWVLWPTINFFDDEMSRIFAATGFELLRRYHFLTRPLDGDSYPPLPSGVSVDVVRTDADYLVWHSAHQDSFSQHFGFTPRPAEPWIRHFQEYSGADPEGRFLLRVNGDVAGFVTCTNDNAHENGGFIDLLGVCHRFHGQGFGKLLLKWAFAYSASRGFTDVDLAVDTGNSSGALGLYSSVGFTTLSEFHLYAKPTD